MFDKKFVFVGGFIQEDLDCLKNILKQNSNIFILTQDLFTNLIKKSIQEHRNKDHLLLVDLIRLELKKLISSIKEKYIIDFTQNCNDIKFIEIINDIIGDVPEYVYILRSIENSLSIEFKNHDNKTLEEFFIKNNTKDKLKDYYISIYTISELYKDNVTFIDTNELRDSPTKTLDLFSKKINLPYINYNLEIDKILSADINLLGDNTISYKQNKFWINSVEEEKNDDLDVSLYYSLQGKFDLSDKKLNDFLEKYPKNYRGLYNKGYTELRNGNLLKGHEYMYYGRYEGVYGNKPPVNDLPEWKGEENKTVLFYMEGGLGDQIHFVRYVKNIRAKNCKVITCCDKSLVNLFKYVDGIDEIIDFSQVNDFIYDCYVPSMSCIIPLKLEYKDISDEPYIFLPPKFKFNKDKLPIIGLRWRGNPTFEHEQHRLFPSNLMFNAVMNLNAKFISLQKDTGVEETPNWVNQIKLESWMDTAIAINNCDYIISSCTSIAHLSAAMGKKTYVIVPILPYFIWAIPDERSVYYKNVRLFRQTVFKSWIEPFKKLNEVLEYETRYYIANS